MNITLTVIPGNGERSISVGQGTTLSDLVATEELQGRVITVDGSQVEAGHFSAVALRDGMSIYATQSVKGN